MKINMFLLILILICSCSRKNSSIETVALVTKQGFSGRILILFNDDTCKGRVVEKNKRHYIFVPDDGVVITKLSLSDGKIEFYDEHLIRKKYQTHMKVMKGTDNSYQIIGPVYSGIKYKGKNYKFLMFNAGPSKSIRREGNSIDLKFIRSAIDKSW